MTTRTAKREEFLADILTTAVEGGINYWAAVTRYKWENLPHADYSADLIETEEDEPKPLHLDIDVVAKGIGILLEENKNAAAGSYWRQFVEANRTNGDDGDYDADIADAIVQAGLFGEVVYG